MRARNFSKTLSIAILSIMLCAVAQLAVADVGGGRGYPVTPWRIKGPNSVLDIEKAKTLASTYQTLSVPAKLVDKRTGVNRIYRVALLPTPSRKGDIAIHEFAGKSDSGEMVAVSFSEIESFTVKSKKKKEITVSVMLWPEISPEELLEKEPTYKQLHASYRRRVVLSLGLKSADGRPLVFTGKWGDTLPLDKLQEGTKISFDTRHPLGLWWAIPSVTNDEDYPFRLIPAL